MGEPWINRGRCTLRLDTERVETAYNARYIGDFALAVRNGSAGAAWSETPAAVFHVDDPQMHKVAAERGYIVQTSLPDINGEPVVPPRETISNYFGLSIQAGSLLIHNALSVTLGFWSGAMARDGEIIYSRYRYDFRTSGDGTISVDGGREYVRFVGRKPFLPVKLSIINGKIVVNETLFLPVREG